MGKVIEAFRSFVCWQCLEHRPADHFLFESVAETGYSPEYIRAFSCWLCRRRALLRTMGPQFRRSYLSNCSVPCGICHQRTQLVHFATSRPRQDGGSWCATCYRQHRLENHLPLRFPMFFYARDRRRAALLRAYVANGEWKAEEDFFEWVRTHGRSR